MFREGYASRILADVYAAIHADKLNTEQKVRETEDDENNDQNENDGENNANKETDV